MSVLLLLLLALLLIPVARWDARRRPYTSCTACRRRPRRNPGSTAKAWGRCGICGGSGERRRALAVIFGTGKDGK